MLKRYPASQMDQQLLQLINQTWTSPAMDRAMAIITNLDVWRPVLLLAGVMLAVFGGFRGRAFLLVMGIAVVVTDGLGVNLTKKFVGRLRPHEALVGVRTVEFAPARVRMTAVFAPLEVQISPERILPPRGRSFPSGHAANTFAVATTMAVFFRPWGALAFLVSAAVAYSRVYVGSHWPTDVAISSLLGIGITLCVIAFCEWIWQRLSPRLPDVITGGRGSLLVA